MLNCRIKMCAAAMAVAAAPAFAAPISADFEASFDLPAIGSGARVFQRLAEPVSGGNEPDLSVVDQIANPSGWAGYATVDLSASGLITLEGDQGDEGADDYDLFEVVISNIVFSMGEFITGVSVISDGLLSDNGAPPPAPGISFTANSVTITYDATGFGGNADFVIEDFGLSEFQISTSTAVVPLPAALPLLGAALGGLGLIARRRKG